MRVGSSVGEGRKVICVKEDIERSLPAKYQVVQNIRYPLRRAEKLAKQETLFGKIHRYKQNMIGLDS